MMRSGIDMMDKVTAIRRYNIYAQAYSTRNILDTYFLFGYDIELSDDGYLWPVGVCLKGHKARWWARRGNGKGPYTSRPNGDISWSFGGVWL